MKYRLMNLVYDTEDRNVIERLKALNAEEFIEDSEEEVKKTKSKKNKTEDNDVVEKEKDKTK